MKGTPLASPKVLVPEVIWQRLVTEFARETRPVERVAYLDGYIVDLSGYPQDGGTVAIVNVLVLPDANLTRGNYQVTASAMSQAGQHLAGWRMTRLAQVHTHGSTAVNHSRTDDDRAYSQQSGALSIVVPNHGRGSPQLDQCGVHLRSPSGWRRQPPAEISTYVEIVPSTYDFRDPPCLTTLTRDRGIYSRLKAWMTRRIRRRPSA